MIHIRTDNNAANADRVFRCGLTGPKLPAGDTYYFEGELGAGKADCPGCNPDGPRKLGTPISELSGRPGEPGYEEFCRIAASWGFD